ncbi:hypothetical protein Bca101_013305 [Brassica carinata]
MSLNCLSCQALPRTDSNKEFDLSGPGPPTIRINHALGKKILLEDQARLKKVKKIPHVRLSGPVGSNPSNGPLPPEQPILVRNSGMRRNWSFENLRDQGLIEEKRR